MSLCIPMNCSMPGCFVLYYLRDLLKFMFIESMILSNHLILYQPLLLLPSVFPSIRVFSNESTLHIRWPKYWSFSNSLPMNIQDRFPFTSVHFSRSVVSNSFRPHESQHTRPPCPSPSPRIHSNSCPSSRLWHPAMSCSVVPFYTCPQSLPASGSFPMSQLFT